MLKSKTTKKFSTKKLFSHSVPKFYDVIRKMLLEFQRIIERALALYAPIKACYIRKDKPKFLLQEKWLCEKQKKQFSRTSDDETKNDLIRQKKIFSRVLWS